MIHGKPSHWDREHLAAIVTVCLLGLLSSLWAICSEGYYQPDDVTHYNFSRFAWAHPKNFLDVWARPIPTLFYAIPALWGFTGARIASAFLAALTAYVTYRLARAYNIARPIGAMLLLFLQPFFFLLSFGVLTEIHFALFFGLALWAFRAKLLALSAFLTSLLPLIRPEGPFFMALWALWAIACHRKEEQLSGIRLFYMLALLGVGSLAYVFARTLTDGLFWFRYLPWVGEPASFYGKGNVFWYVYTFGLITGFATPLFIVGLAVFWKERQWTILGTFFYFFALHTFLWTFGLFKSAGYHRYFVCVSPVIALIALRGYNWIMEQMDHRVALSEIWQQIVLLKKRESAFLHEVLPLLKGYVIVLIACVYLAMHLVSFGFPYLFFKAPSVFRHFIFVVPAAALLAISRMGLRQIIALVGSLLVLMYGASLISHTRSFSWGFFAMVTLPPLLVCAGVSLILRISSRARTTAFHLLFFTSAMLSVAVDQVPPIPASETYQIVQRAAHWYQDYSQEHDIAYFVCYRPDLYMYLDKDPHGEKQASWICKKDLSTYPQGTLIFWDSHLMKIEAGISVEDFNREGYREIAVSGLVGQNFEIRIFRKP